MVLQFPRNTDHPSIAEPTSAQICEAIEECHHAYPVKTVLLSRAEDDWIETDGKKGMRFRQKGTGDIYSYYCEISFPTLVYVFLRYANNDDGWKEEFKFEYEMTV
jgi:hypothetical protein